MYILNITFFVEESIEEEWVGWSKSKFEEVKETSSYFNQFTLMRLLSHSEPNQVTYTCQLHTDSAHKIQLFEIEIEPDLLNENKDKFGEKSIFFKSLMQIVK